MSEVLQAADERGVITSGTDGGSARWEMVSLLRTLCAGLIGGGLAGFLVGGVLGRLVLQLVAVTSAGGAEGRVTGDGPAYWNIPLASTLSLAAALTVAGALGGLLYLVVRRVLPTSRGARVLLHGVATVSVGGTLVVQVYSRFDVPDLTTLSLVLLLALPLLYGWAVAGLVESFDGPDGWARRTSLPSVLVTTIVTSLAVPFVFLLATMCFALALVARGVPVLGRLWDSRAVTVLGRAAFVMLVAVALFGTSREVLSLFSGGMAG